VVGVSAAQDTSDRKMQFAAKPPHWDPGGSFDTFGPTGLVLVSLDEVDEPTRLANTTVQGYAQLSIGLIPRA
jgi:2-keto-4-pentenoate hydratase/2-oxohepta-3-ene-1,7-dioic acid hydratase in catechol pathway